MQASEDRVHYLDGLRGVAAVAVVIFHLNIFFSVLLPYEGLAGIPRMLLGRLTNGNFAVCIFFVLSGYVLTVPFRRGKLDLGEAAVRRYFRLTPVAFASVMLSYFVWVTIGYYTKGMTAHGPGFAWMEAEFAFKPEFWKAVYNGLFGIYTGNNSYNGVLWTISLELWGSLFLFAFLSLFGRHAAALRVALAVAIVLVVMLGRETGAYLSLFLAGAMLCLHPTFKLSWLWMVPALYLGSLDQWSPEALAATKSLGLPWGQLHHVSGLHAIGAVLLISALLGSPRIQRLFSLGFIQCLGKLSYSIYAVHFVLIFSVGNWTFSLMAQAGYYRLAALATIVAVLACTLGISAVLYRFVDLPSQEFAKWVGRVILGRKAREPSVQPADVRASKP